MARYYKIQLSLIALDKSSYHIIAKGRINELPVNLVIDTGASMSVFDRDYLKDHLPEPEAMTEEIHSAGITADKIEASRSTAESFALEKFVIHQFPLVLINMNKINKLYSKVTGTTIHGLLGSDFLHSMNAVIDYGKSVMILKPDNSS